MPDHGDELLAQPGRVALRGEGGPAALELLLPVELQRDELREELEGEGASRAELAGTGSMAQSVPQKLPSVRMIGTET